MQATSDDLRERAVAASPARSGPTAPRRCPCGSSTRRDATLAELSQQLVAPGSPVVGQTVLWQQLRPLELRRKKESAHRRARR